MTLKSMLFQWTHTYSAGYADIYLNPNDGNNSVIVATANDPWMADQIAMALNRQEHRRRPWVAYLVRWLG